MMRRAGVVAVALALAVTTACSLLTSFDGFDEPKVTDAASDVAVDSADASVTDPCLRRRWPPPPTKGSDGDVGELVSALRSMKTVNESGLPYGFDLDNLCSCPERVACLGSQPNQPCDPKGSGIDNAASDLFFLFSKATGTSLDETGLRSGLDRGKFSVVFRLGRWNGEANDPEVTLQVLNAFDANQNADAGARFDGNDTWVIDSESLVGALPTSPVFKAYVSDGVLVAEMPNLVFKARIPTVDDKWLLLRVVLRDAHITARIARTGAGFSLTEGQLGGRSPAAELITLGMYLGACPGGVAFTSVKPILCDARDLPIDPAKDGRDFACDAVSVGVAFETSPAKVAPLVGTPVDTFPCTGVTLPVDCK